jgi:hypothetical protein
MKRSQQLTHGVQAAAHAVRSATATAAAPPSTFPKATAMFKRPSTHYGKSPEPETPYQRAAQVWDDRIGSARVQAKNWRLMAFGSLILSAGLRHALVWQSARGSIVPWVVQVDRLGQAQAVAPATADYRRPIRRSPSTSRASSSRSARSRPMRSSCGRTGCAPTTSRPIAARWRSTTMPAPTTPSPRSASSRSPSRSRRHPRVAGQLPRRLDRAPLSGRPARRDRTLDRHPHHRRAAAARRRPAAKNPLGIYVNAINWSKELGQ